MEYEWRPHPTVCKRFNVPCPYNDGLKEYGTVKSDKKATSLKFSLFNVLSAATRFDKEKSKNLFDELNSDLNVVKSRVDKGLTQKDQEESKKDGLIVELEFDSKR